jgi:hypothetical protein
MLFSFNFFKLPDNVPTTSWKLPRETSPNDAHGAFTAYANGGAMKALLWQK